MAILNFGGLCPLGFCCCPGTSQELELEASGGGRVEALWTGFLQGPKGLAWGAWAQAEGTLPGGAPMAGLRVP